MLILLLGPPGCGKGTQSKRLINKLNASYLGMGDIIRNEINCNTDLGTRMQQFISNGDLVPDELISMVFEKNFKHEELNPKNNIILDGYPRTLSQANFLKKNFYSQEKSMKIIFMDVPNDILIKRLLDRKRTDDTEDVIKNRLNVYHSETMPLLDYYNNRVQKISGVGSEDEIFNRIYKLL